MAGKKRSGISGGEQGSGLDVDFDPFAAADSAVDRGARAVNQDAPDAFRRYVAPQKQAVEDAPDAFKKYVYGPQKEAVKLAGAYGQYAADKLKEQPIVQALPAAAKGYGTAVTGPLGALSSAGGTALGSAIGRGIRGPDARAAGEAAGRTIAEDAPQYTGQSGPDLASKAPYFTGTGPGGGAGAPQAPQGGGGGGGMNSADARLRGLQDQQVDDTDRRNKYLALAGQASLEASGVEADELARAGNEKWAASQAYEDESNKTFKEREEHETKIAKANDEAAARGIDPQRYFKNRDMGFWSSMTIGAVASGMLSAISGRGGENPFLDHVRQAAQQDINAQEEDIQQGWRKVKGMETAYERARALGADRVTATIRVYDGHLAAMQSDMQAKLAKAKLPEQRYNLMAGLEALQKERDGQKEAIERYWQQVAGQRANAAAAAAAARIREARENLKTIDEHELKQSEVAKNYATASGEQTKKGDEFNKLFVKTGEDKNGFVHTGVIAADGESRKKMEDAGATREALVAKLDRIKAIREQTGAAGRFAGKVNIGSYVMPPKWQTELKSLEADVKSDVNHMKELGAWDKGSEALIAGMVGDMTTVGGQADTQVDMLRKAANEKYSATLNGRGRVASRYFDTRTGQWVGVEQPGKVETPAATVADIPGARPLGR